MEARLLILLLFAVPAWAQLPVVQLPQLAPANSVPTGATIWYRPDDVTNANTANLAFWPDHSGNGYNGGAPNVAWTNNVLNGYGSSYPGGTPYITMTNAIAVMNAVAGASCFTVISIDTTTPIDTIVSFWQNPTPAQRFFFSTDGSGLLRWQGATHDGDTIRTIGPVSANPSGFFLCEAVITYSAGTGKMWTNGTLLGSVSTLTAANTSNANGQQNPNWGRFDQAGGKGKCVEFLFYTNAISDATRTNVIEPYFRNKYNLW